MFASLKNKIKEETGNDPTTRNSSGTFHRRPAEAQEVNEASKSVNRLKSSEDSAFSSTHRSSEILERNSHNNLKSPILSTIQTESTNEGNCDTKEKVQDVHVKKHNRNDMQVEKAQELGLKGNDLESPKAADEFKRKVYGYLEDVDQLGLENFLLRELAKIQLLDNSEVEVRNVVEQLAEAKYQVKEAASVSDRLSHALTAEKNENALLSQEIAQLKDEIQEHSKRSNHLSLSLERELQEKDVTLLRNAQLNQDLEITKQTLRSYEQETSDLYSKSTNLESKLSERDEELRLQKLENEELHKKIEELGTIGRNENLASKVEQDLRKNITSLEDQLAEKIKSIRVLQQHSSDLKKTLQKELKQNGEENVENMSSITPAQYTSSTSNEPDVNFKYLKHVIMKFLTSREYEAQHLTRAVSTLLRFSPEEERLLRDTLDWKMSWFGTRPRLGLGQTSKTIPPS